MSETVIDLKSFMQLVSARHPKWWTTIAPSIVRQDATGVWFQTDHAAYTRAEKLHGPIPGSPATRPAAPSRLNPIHVQRTIDHQHDDARFAHARWAPDRDGEAEDGEAWKGQRRRAYPFKQ